MNLPTEQQRFYNPHHHLLDAANTSMASPKGWARRDCFWLHYHSDCNVCYIQVTPGAPWHSVEGRIIEECGMKKVVVASLLAVASVAMVSRIAVAQTQVNLGSNAQASSGGIQMSPAEYKAYNDAISESTPQTKAPALEAYLTAYPQSCLLYTSDAADDLLCVDLGGR